MPQPGDWIKAVRGQRNWTQEQLAEAAGISKGFLSDIENDKRNISSESALKIADALGISLDYLLRGETGQREIQRRPVTIPGRTFHARRGAGAELQRYADTARSA